MRHVFLMNDKLETLNARGERLLKLHNMLAAREGRAEYKENCEAIRAEIKRLEGRDL
jgi:hypothetical protein